MTSAAPIPEPTLKALLRAGAEAWEAERAAAGERFQGFIPCDQRGAHERLLDLRPRAASFLELGSGAGVVTILADLLGFEAYGIELLPGLVRRSAELAERFDSTATFVQGSFVPPEYQEEVELLSADFLTTTRGAPAYEELGLELDDFDLLFAYPWPGEEEWLFELVRRHAREDALLLTYDAREGFRLYEGLSAGREEPLDESEEPRGAGGDLWPAPPGA